MFAVYDRAKSTPACVGLVTASSEPGEKFARVGDAAVSGVNISRGGEFEDSAIAIMSHSD